MTESLASGHERPAGRPLGECDRCGKEIMATTGNEILTLRATCIKMGQESYHLEVLLCPDCRAEFKNWLIKRSG